MSVWDLPGTIEHLPDYEGPTTPLYELSQHASVIVAWAKHIGGDCEHAVTTVIEWTRKLLGDAPKTRALLAAFGPIQQSITDGRTGLQGSSSRLEANWDGRAANSAIKYFAGIDKSSDTVANAVTGMVACLESFLTTISKVYQGMLTFIANCAADILNTVGGVLGSLEGGSGESKGAASSAEVSAAKATPVGAIAGLVSDVAEQVTKLLGEFIKNVTALLNTAIDAATTFRNAAATATNLANQAQPPDDLSKDDVAVGTDGGRWYPSTVRPQPK